MHHNEVNLAINELPLVNCEVFCVNRQERHQYTLNSEFLLDIIVIAYCCVFPFSVVYVVEIDY